MKYFIVISSSIICIIIALSIISITARAQNHVYCDVIGVTKLMSRKVTISLDSGQQAFNKQHIIRDENGKAMLFNSIIHAVNYMSSRGWEYVDSYSVNVPPTIVYHYLMRKEDD